VLTGATEELQKFVARYVKTDEAWDDSFEFKKESLTPTIGRIARD
jgi:hypothetical protein